MIEQGFAQIYTEAHRIHSDQYAMHYNNTQEFVYERE